MKECSKKLSKFFNNEDKLIKNKKKVFKALNLKVRA